MNKLNRNNLEKLGIWPTVKRPKPSKLTITLWRIAFMVTWGLVIIINIVK